MAIILPSLYCINRCGYTPTITRVRQAGAVFTITYLCPTCLAKFERKWDSHDQRLMSKVSDDVADRPQLREFSDEDLTILLASPGLPGPLAAEDSWFPSGRRCIANQT